MQNSLTDQEFGHQGPPEGCTRSSEAAAGRAPAPPRPALTRQRIVETALQLVERHGLDGLTMRRVAAALQVTPMSLYNHVADKAELVDLMVDYVIEDVVARSAQDEGDWEARIRGLCRRNYEVWKAHPGIVRIYAEGVSLGPNGLANLEHAVEILRQAGFSDDDAGSAVTLLYRWSMASLVVSRAQPTAADQPPLPQTATKEERMAAYFSALPREEIPNIEASAMTLSATSFDFGLDVIIAGLKARLAATTALQEPPDVQPGTSPGSPETAAEAAC